MENGLFKMNSTSQENDNRGSRLVHSIKHRKESQCSTNEAIYKTEFDFLFRRDSDLIKIVK